ncbi:MAG: ParB N-terminal domain-containing protein [Bacteroides sp.]|nr:ParB N-terminal domain-containing protein [Bacteroidales bacterium]MCM1068705.1 ParB N-terminal domain-containing protein [Prevotella sp.]MCM1354695.1 ParB N-terminal domain-containing protein [Bacteroides sp.]MCM1403757.1 ParB N-terminal domain-containing protein [Bacteroides sp.]MCM1443525.1 ParB N-terminal domain-containing protein [Muribaculum sp.]
MNTISTTLLTLTSLAKNEGQIEGLPANPRLIRDERYAKLVQSIKDNPEMLSLRELLVYQHGDKYIIIGGNMRFAAIQELGYKEAPCKIIPADTSVENLRAYTLKDNSGYGEWEWDLLANEWEMDELDAAAIDIPLLEDNHPTNIETADVEEDDFDETTDEIPSRCQAGDIWQLGNHRLICGDSTKADDIARLMQGEKADLWITDPPYNVNYEGCTEDKLKIANDNMNSGDFFRFLNSAFKVAHDNLKEGCAFYIWYASREHINFETALNAVGLKVREQLIWNKSSLVLGRFDYHYKHEPCLYGWKDGAAHSWYNDRSQTTVMDFEKPRNNDLHPTMKPVPLFAYQIANSSKKGDIVLDTFGGSGTTIIACENLQRKARCVELDPHYCDVILARWEKLTNKQTVKL